MFGGARPTCDGGGRVEFNPADDTSMCNGVNDVTYELWVSTTPGQLGRRIDNDNARLVGAGVANCGACPVADLCAWRGAGYPAYDGPPRRGQSYDGTDRQCRGRILALAREDHAPVHRSRIDSVWPADEQRERCLASLVDDGLLVPAGGDAYALP